MADKPSYAKEMFSAPSASCPHQFHWDDADDVYRCLYCDSTREEPPEKADDSPGEGDNT